MAAELLPLSGLSPSNSSSQTASFIPSGDRGTARTQAFTERPVESGERTQQSGTLSRSREAEMNRFGQLDTQSQREKQEQESQALDPQALSAAVDKLNEMLNGKRQLLTFQVDDDAGEMVIRVVDSQTDEVIRQIPSEEALKFAQYVEGLTGLIFNGQA